MFCAAASILLDSLRPKPLQPSQHSKLHCTDTASVRGSSGSHRYIVKTEFVAFPTTSPRLLLNITKKHVGGRHGIGIGIPVFRYWAVPFCLFRVRIPYSAISYGSSGRVPGGPTPIMVCGGTRCPLALHPTPYWRVAHKSH